MAKGSTSTQMATDGLGKACSPFMVVAS